MTEDRRTSTRSGSHNPWGVNDSLAQVRVYGDDAALERVWNRLETRRRRSGRPGPLSISLAAAALVAAGVFIGMSAERSRMEGAQVALASSEVIQAPGVSTGHEEERGEAAPQRRVAVRDPATPRRSGRSPSQRRVQASGATEPTELLLVDPSARDAVVAVDEVAPPVKAAWLLLAERGDFAAAFQELDESGGFDLVLANGGSEELMTLADVARFVGRHGRAIQALRAVTDRYQGDQNAPIAAMMLGNLLSKAGDGAGAAEAYALNRRLSPGGDFAEDALKNEFDMAMADGDLASVERLRAQYEAEFPDGRHLDEILAEAARLAELSPENVVDASGGPKKPSGRPGPSTEKPVDEVRVEPGVGPSH